MTSPQTEADLLDELVHQYRRNGYEVRRDASLPPPLESFRADLIVERDDEMIVVEVKDSTRITKDSERRLSELAATINALPGWTFELVTFAPPPDRSSGGASHIHAWLRQAREVAPISRLASILVASTAIEATLRHLDLSSAEDDRPARGINAPGLIRRLQVDGRISDNQADRLLNFWRVRSAAAHGYSDPAIDDLDYNPLLGWAEVAAQDSYATVDDMVDWFHENYIDPWEGGLSYDKEDGDYIWMGRGPHEADDVLVARFPNASDLDLADAIEAITADGLIWAER